MYHNVELFKEPVGILERMEEPYVEISSEELAFLCGLIKKVKPKKIVEVGVAGGGTTAVIMKCLSILGQKDTVIYSVDINEECYRRAGKKTGWQLEEVKEEIENYENHTFLLGRILPQVIHGIGGEIDMVILDTMHTMPGEILDFLCILPHLTNNAVVVLHDIMLNLLIGGHCYATKILLDSVSGEKFLDLHYELPNIGAFRITEDTMHNIENVFSALSITWNYFVEPKMIVLYRESFKNFYPDSCLTLFDRIVYMQYQRYGLDKVNVNKEINKCQKFCKSGRKIFLYGAGIRGNRLRKYISKQGGEVSGFIISDDYDPKDFENLGKPVYRISEMPKEDEMYLVLATPAPEVFFGLLEKAICFEFFSEKFYEEIVDFYSEETDMISKK